MIWTHREARLNEFIQYLNGIHPTIKFTHELSHSQIDLLDTTVKINDSRQSYTALHEKPTDTHLYLHYTSSHYNPGKTKGPYGQFLRHRKICTYDGDFQENAERLTGYYLKRGYPEKVLRKHYKRGARHTQNELLKVRQKSQLASPVMVANYNPCNPNIKGICHRNWNIISSSADCGHLFQHKPIVGFRRLTSLRDTLTNATLQYPPVVEEKNTPKPDICTRLGKCTYCHLVKN